MPIFKVAFPYGEFSSNIPKIHLVHCSHCEKSTDKDKISKKISLSPERSPNSQ